MTERGEGGGERGKRERGGGGAEGGEGGPTLEKEEGFQFQTSQGMNGKTGVPGGKKTHYESDAAKTL